MVDSQADSRETFALDSSIPDVIENDIEHQSTTTSDERDIPGDKQKCRIFVANFSYDPITMSPNVELVDDELAFFEGDLIKVYGEVCSDGFYFGELNGKRGYLPGNMVSEVSPSDYKSTERLSNGDSFFDISAGNNRKVTTEINIEESQKPRTNFDNEPSHTNTENVRTSPNKSTVVKLRDHTTTYRVINSKSSSVNNLSRDSDNDNKDFTTISGKHRQSTSLPNVSAEYFDKLEYDIDNDLYDSNPNDPSFERSKPTWMIALFNYDPVTSSPNVDAEVRW